MREAELRDEVMQISDWERFEAAGDCFRAALTIIRDLARHIEADAPLETVKILDTAADQLEALMDGLISLHTRP